MSKNTMRISKEPEIRKQEIIEIAMQVFIEKGYEQTTMRDIAKAVKVVPGLCYRYFESKEDLYNCAVSQYVEDFCKPMVKLFNIKIDNIEDLLDGFAKLFIKRDGNEKYHTFFHSKGNEKLHKLLSINVCEYMLPYVINTLNKLNDNGILQIEDVESVSSFILFGQIPIIGNIQLTSIQKTKQIKQLVRKILL
jgi:AcrR family transcriptional regulator